MGQMATSRERTGASEVQSHIALKYHRTNIPKSIRPQGKLIQSSSLLPLNYERSLDEIAAARDSFYAVSELFTFCAFSESQFLNMLQAKLDSMIREETLLKRPLELSNLLYMQKTVKRHIQRLRDNIQTIEAHGSITWPKAEDERPSDKVEAAVGVLGKQYDNLLRRAESLSAQIEDQTRFLTNKAMIDEATRARHQAIEVTKLTRLAFFYIPLSFVASFFGTNLDPLAEARNSLIWFFVVSIPVFGVSMAFMKWDIWEGLRRLWRVIIIRQRRPR